MIPFDFPFLGSACGRENQPPFSLQSLLHGICLLMEHSKPPWAAPLLWSSDCNGNSHQGMKCHCSYLMIKDSMPVRESSQGLRLSPCALFYLCSLPRPWLIDLWKGSEVVLSGKDTLYLLVANPRRDRGKKIHSLPRLLCLTLSSIQFPISSNPQHPKNLSLPGKETSREQPSIGSGNRVREGRQEGRKVALWACSHRLRRIATSKSQEECQWPEMSIMHEKPESYHAASWQLRLTHLKLASWFVSSGSWSAVSTHRLRSAV